MIAETDSLRLAPGVTTHNGRLADSVRGDSWPINGSAVFVLTRTGSPLGQVVRDLASTFALPVETARTDVLQFAWSLNALALVNVHRHGSAIRRFLDWLTLAVRLAPAGSLPGSLARRRRLDTSTIPRGVASCLVALWPRVVCLAVVTVLVAVQIGAMGGAISIAGAVALAVGSASGIALHEASHVAMLRRVPSALVLRGRQTFVLHAPVTPTRRSLVAVAGPAGAMLVGVAASMLGTAATVPELIAFGCPLMAHGLALTAIGGDGRVACGL